MRPLEIIMPLLLAIQLLWKRPRPAVVRWLPVAVLVLILLHFATEGYRWQMIPIYVLTFILGMNALIRIKSPTDWKPLASILTLILLAVSAALPVLLPVPAISAPSGPYKVGTVIYELTDSARKELYSE